MPAAGERRSPGPFSKRARELQLSETHIPYRSPSLSPSLTPPQIYTTDPPLLPPVQEEPTSGSLASPPGLSRRARADTLPSTFHLANTSSVSSASAALRHLSAGLLAPPSLSNGTTTSLPASGSSTPISDFAYSSTPSASTPGGALVPPPLTASRLRSGSLSLPSSGLSNAFGPSVFSNGAWPPQANPPLPLGKPSQIDRRGDGVMSPDSSYGDDSHVRTLDYLGLEGDSPVGGYGPFSDHAPLGLGAGAGAGARQGADGAEQHHQHLRGRGISLSAAATPMHRLGSVGNLSAMNDILDTHHGRIRSNTVATFPRTAVGDPPSAASNIYRGLPSPFPGVHDEDYFGSGEQGGGGGSSNPSSYHRSSDSTDSSRLLYSTTAQEETDAFHAHSRSSSVVGGGGGLSAANGGGVKDSPSRARAATIGILDESREVFMRKRAGTTTGLTPHAVQMGLVMPSSGAASLEVPSEYPMTRGMRGLSISQPDEQGGWNPSRPLTPEASSLTPPPQQPTRSLWIGNLDPKTSTAELQAVFAPYGAIESLRLIPEKECGFVNFVSISDAVHAKEDVLNRLGGQLTQTSGMVRIGFGKADAAPSSSSAGATLSHMRSLPGLHAGVGGPGMPEMNLQAAPTRALWIGSIPSSTTPSHLLSIFAPFGAIESARVLTHKSCGFVNFERTEDAMSARKALNGREILGAEVGSVRIGFAKVPTKSLSPPGPYGDSPPPPPALTVYTPLKNFGGEEVGMQDYRSNLVVELGGGRTYQGPLGGSGGGGSEEVDESRLIQTVQVETGDLQLLMREISGDTPETEEHVKAVSKPREVPTYYTSIPQQALTDPALARRYVNADAPRLRDIRKRLDSPQISTDEVDSIAYDLLEECVALSSDYIGNTLIQKIFERASLAARVALLERIAPHLATIGTHKNGTWAIQKIIQSVKTPEEFSLIEKNLQPYTPPLLLNDFGNYVVQGALRFQTDFIFDAMVDRCWEIGSGRFGARSTRQTLESNLASRLNIKRVAIAIVLNSIPLATSSNGALLVTWLLDTSNLPGRYRLLAPRFAPHLAHLCTHKLGSVAVLKVVNQRVEPKASRIVLDALFDQESNTLEDILGDQIHGTACVSKLLASNCVDPKEKAVMCERVRNALIALRVQSVPAYRKLTEDLGLTFQGPASTSAYAQSTSYPTQPSPPQLGSSPGQQHQQQLPPQWSPQLGGPNYGPYDYQMMGYYAGMPGYPQYFAPQNFYPPPPTPGNNFLGIGAPPASRGGGGVHVSPMIAPMALASSASSFSSPRVGPASLSGVSSPDPFSALRVVSGDPRSGFHPSFSPQPNQYFRGRYGESPAGLRPEAEFYHAAMANPANGQY